MLVVVGAVAGIVGGAICMGLGLANFVTGVAFGAVYGAIFGLLVASRARTPGAGLMWSLAYVFLLWLAVPAGILPVVAGGMPAMGMLDTARAPFPQLVAYIICFGLPFGLA